MTALHGVRVFIGGEGANEIGDAARGQIGVIEALLRRVQPERWEVGGTQQWCKIRKYKAGDHRTAEQRNLLGLALIAWESGCELLAFSRDAGDVADDDQQYITAMELARDEMPHMQIVGGLARPMLEGWILALRGDANTDALTKAEAAAAVEAAGMQLKSCSDYVDVVATSTMDLQHGTTSLSSWLANAKAAFARVIERTE